MIVGGCIVAGILAVALSPGEREPEYGGKKLSEWVNIYVLASAGSRAKGQAQTAVRNIGTNGIPFLLSWIRDDAPAWKLGLLRAGAVVERKWSKGGRILNSMAGNPELRSWASVSGFGILGAEAKGAVPDLRTIMLQTEWPMRREEAALSMANVGEAGSCALLDVATNRAFPLMLRGYAIQALDERWMMPDRPPVVLTSAAVPGLVGMLDEPDYALRSAATNVLWKLAPETLGTNAVRGGEGK